MWKLRWSTPEEISTHKHIFAAYLASSSFSLFYGEDADKRLQARVRACKNVICLFNKMLMLAVKLYWPFRSLCSLIEFSFIHRCSAIFVPK